MRTNNVLALRDANSLAPPATGAATEWVTRMGDALREAVTADDVAEIMKGVVAKAKEGDTKAIKQVLDFVGQATSRPQVVVGVRASVPQHGPNGRHVPRVIEDVPPDEEIRSDCAEVLGRDGPLTTPDLARRAGYTEDEIERVLAARGPGLQEFPLPQFDHNRPGYWRLTASGRAELLDGVAANGTHS